MSRGRSPMLRQLMRVAEIVRPRHLLKALVHPVQELQAFRYHYRRVPERDFVAFLAGCHQDDAEPLRKAYEDLEGHREFVADVKRQLSIQPKGYGGQMVVEATAIYALVRLLVPERIIETGVADGATSTFILRALEDNRKGKLYSIDVPSERLPPGKAPGWVVRDELRHRWDLRIGKAEELLVPLLQELGWIDWFLHDSLHTYDHMLLEYRTAWPRMRPGGLFLSHDVGRNLAFMDFAKEVGMRWRDWRVYFVLGGFRKGGDPERG